tara:strand:+ start:728 stop:1702 length:975 start_codon:yes stop_codon:yes gene_type:complete
MCGIVAYIGQDTPINKLMYLMHDNDSRGGHSSGAFIDGKIYKCTEKSGNLLHMLDINNAELFIGHTRYATHGVKTAENTHPYVNGKYIGVHNGVLSNYEELLEEENLPDVDVDSKAIYSLLNKTNDYATLGKHSGTINAVWTQSDGQLYVYRRNNPLFRLRTDQGIYFSSLEEGLLAIAEDKSKVKEVTKDKLFVYSPTGELVESIKIPVTAPKYEGKNWYDYGKQSSYNGWGTAGLTSWSKADDDAWNRSWNIEPEAKQDTKPEVKETDTIDWYSEDWYEVMAEGLDVVSDLFKEIKEFNSISSNDIAKVERFIELVEQEIYQ